MIELSFLLPSRPACRDIRSTRQTTLTIALPRRNSFRPRPRRVSDWIILICLISRDLGLAFPTPFGRCRGWRLFLRRLYEFRRRIRRFSSIPILRCLIHRNNIRHLFRAIESVIIIIARKFIVGKRHFRHRILHILIFLLGPQFPLPKSRLIKRRLRRFENLAPIFQQRHFITDRFVEYRDILIDVQTRRFPNHTLKRRNIRIRRGFGAGDAVCLGAGLRLRSASLFRDWWFHVGLFHGWVIVVIVV